MNTHDIDIELPAEFRSGNDIPVTQATIKRERMEEILTAAIEADRKRRGEPVAYLDLGVGGYIDVGSDLTDEELAALPKGRHMLAIVGTYGVDGYTEAAPQPAEPVDKSKNLQGSPVDKSTKMQGQPAEPVKVPSPVEIKALAEEHLSVEDVPGYGPTVSGEGEFARALLARYGNAAPFQVDHELVSKWQQANGITKDPAEPSKQSEVREYFQQTLRTAADEACRLIANSDTPTKFEGIFGHRAEPVAEVSQKISGEPGINGSVLYAGVNWIKAPPPFGTKLYTAPVVAQPSAEPPSSD